MPALLTRGDSLREFLTGAASAGGAQSSPILSLGGHRASSEVRHLGIRIDDAIPGLSIDYAAGGNQPGPGILLALSTPDNNTVVWAPYGGHLGDAAALTAAAPSAIVEALDDSGSFLRVSGTPPFPPSACTITLSVLADNYFAMPVVTVAESAAGVNHYRASVLRNVSSGTVRNFKRWLTRLGDPQPSDLAQLGASGAGTIQTSGDFLSWPDHGWFQIRYADGALRELVYYSSRTDDTLTVPAAGRGLFGFSAAAGNPLDEVIPVPGVLAGLDPAGVVTSTTAIQTVASPTTAPTGVTWNYGVDESMGLLVESIASGKQIGIWMWRHCPAGVKASHAARAQFTEQFDA